MKIVGSGLLGRKCIPILFFFFCSFFLYIWLTAPLTHDFDENGFTDIKHYIAHAGGGIDGHPYTNSREALLKSIQRGYQYVELDLYQTVDDKLVCLHDMDMFNTMTNSNHTQLDVNSFQKSKILGAYTPLTFKEAMKLCEENDIIIVTDKLDNPAILNHYIKNKEKVLVEVKNVDDYVDFKNNGYDAMLNVQCNVRGILKYIYSCVVCGKRIKRIVTRNGANAKVLRIFKRVGVDVAVYLDKDDESYCRKFLGKEVDLIYTDFIFPQ